MCPLITHSALEGFMLRIYDVNTFMVSCVARNYKMSTHENHLPIQLGVKDEIVSFTTGGHSHTKRGRYDNNGFRSLDGDA